MSRIARFFVASLSLCLLCFALPAAAADDKPLRIGVVTFLSGPGAAAFGIPSRNAAELMVNALNAGEVPAPYATKGFGGRPIEWIVIDEAGPPSKVVSDYRDLVQRREVDLVIGYGSSGSCLAVAPVAEELQMLTVFFTCGTPRLFEDGSYRYVFRTASHATVDNVGAALYVKQHFPQATRIAGINQNYAFGQDSWRDFETSLKQLMPKVEVTTSQMPKLFGGQFGAEISALLQSNPEVIHSSLWGGDLDAFTLQSASRDLFKQSRVVYTVGEPALLTLKDKMPEGIVIGARGPHGVFAPDNALNRWFKRAYETRYNVAPIFSSYHFAQAILGVKSAYEKAKAANGKREPSRDQIIAALTGLTYETPSGTTKMALGKGHQGVQGMSYGVTKMVNGKVTVADITYFSPEQVNPPEGMKSEDWIRAGLGR